MIRRFAIALAAALAGCASTPGTIVRDRPVPVNVPVPQPCAGERPAKVQPLKERVPPAEWAQHDVRQKAALVGGQGLDRQAYGEQLDAATAGCPEVGGG